MIAALQFALGIVMPLQVAVTAGDGPARQHETAAAPAHVAIAVAAPSNVDNLFVSPEGRGVQRNRRDEWFGNDKLRHFLMSMAATQFSYGGLRTANAKDDLALPFAIGIAAVAGVGKEVHDVRNDGPFSLKDLVWDAAGIVVAGVVLGAVR